MPEENTHYICALSLTMTPANGRSWNCIRQSLIPPRAPISPRNTRNPAGSPADKQSPTLNICFSVLTKHGRMQRRVLSVGLFVLHIVRPKLTKKIILGGTLFQCGGWRMSKTAPCVWHQRYLLLSSARWCRWKQDPPDRPAGRSIFLQCAPPAADCDGSAFPAQRHLRRAGHGRRRLPPGRGAGAESSRFLLYKISPSSRRCGQRSWQGRHRKCYATQRTQRRG